MDCITNSKENYNEIWELKVKSNKKRFKKTYPYPVHGPECSESLSTFAQFPSSLVGPSQLNCVQSNGL